MDDAKAEVLAFTSFPRAHWVTVRSTHPPERLDEDVKRRARVVAIVPNAASMIRLVAAVLADARDECHAGGRRCLCDGSMATLFPERDTGAVAEPDTGDCCRGSNPNPTTLRGAAEAKNLGVTERLVRDVHAPPWSNSRGVQAPA